MVVVAVEILRSGVVTGGAMEEEEEDDDDEGDDVATRRVDKNDEDDDDAEKKLLLPCLHDDSIGNSSLYRQDICLPPSGCKVTCRPTNDMPAA